jgi:hypothetical protein
MDDAAGPPPLVGGPAHDVFVSYSSHDKPVADAVVARLEQAGLRCWVAPRDIVPGAIWSEAIVGAIQTSRVMVVVFSAHTNASRQVLREVERAMANDVVVVPFRVASAEPSGALAYYLASEHWLDAITPPLEAHIDQLTRVTSGLLGRSTGPGGSPSAPPPPPPPAAPASSAPPSARRRPSRGVAIGAAAVIAAVVVGIVAMALLRSDDDAGPTAGGWPLLELERGDCVEELLLEITERATAVPCEQPHEMEVLFVGEPWPVGDDYPGDADITDAAYEICEQEFEAYVGVPYLDSVLYLYEWHPSEAAWGRGERWLACAITGDEALEGSVEGSGA